MDTGISYMFTNKRKEELKNVFKLFKLYPQHLISLNDVFYSYIKKRGKDINENIEISKDSNKFIPEIINLKKEMGSLVTECFENHPQFHSKKNKAFTHFMNNFFHYKKILKFYKRSYSFLNWKKIKNFMPNNYQIISIFV